MEEGVLLRAHVDEAEARLEGIDLPTDETVVELFAQGTNGLIAR